MATFHLLNFGCRASQADGAALKRQLQQAGLEEVSCPGESQIAILNTCTVTATADAEVRQIVRRIHRQNPACRILVTGCYAQRAPEEIARLEGVAWVVGNSHKHAIAEVLRQEPEARSQKSKEAPRTQLVHIQTRNSGPGPQREPDHLPSTSPGNSPTPNPQARIPNPQSPIPNPGLPRVLVGEITEEFHFAPVFPDDRTRPTLKVQDGCNARCSFCVIPTVRGRSRSLAPEQVIAEVRALGQAGYQEVVLSGINLGSYGKDLGRRITFLGLVERVVSETGIARLRISSIEPMDVSPALIGLVAREPRMARHFHVPLQSGCDRILRLMNRRYWARQYAERLQAIREAIPDCGLGADVMVGFPGETAADHAASARFIASLPLTYVHIFPYSARPGTPAARAPNQVNGRVARERAREIRGIVAEKRQGFLESQVGSRVSALTLDESHEGARIALTTHYLKVALPGSNVPANHLADVWVGRVTDGLLFGYPAL